MKNVIDKIITIFIRIVITIALYLLTFFLKKIIIMQLNTFQSNRAQLWETWIPSTRFVLHKLYLELGYTECETRGRMRQNRYQKNNKIFKINDR